MVKAEVKKAIKGQKVQFMTRSRDYDSDGSEDKMDPMSFQLGKRTIDHMFGGSASYESKR